MKSFYDFAVNQLKNYGESLQMKSLFLNKPWSLIDGDQEIQRLIFKKNKELIISKNGNVIFGSWEYLPEANSLLINRQGETILVNESFVNEAVLILKKDGTSSNYFILANQNIIPNLDVISYLKKLRYEKLTIKTAKLQDNQKLEIFTNKDMIVEVGNKTLINYKNPKNGTYLSEKGSIKFNIQDSKLKDIFYMNTYQTKSKTTIIIEQRDRYVIQKGDKVYLDENIAPEGKYLLKENENIKVKAGIVVSKPWF